MGILKKAVEDALLLHGRRDFLAGAMRTTASR
jgi:hypothetical protein